MKFSLLMSIYIKENKEDLEECFNSIIQQTLLPNEVIIIQDGPLTRELKLTIKEFINKIDANVILHEFSENRGLQQALKVGVTLCSYELIARMDTDDILSQNRFEIQVEEFKNDKSLSLLGGQVIEFEGSIENKLSKRSVPLSHKDILKFSKKRNPFNHPTVMYKKSVVISVGNYRTLAGPGYEDYDLWIRILKEGYKSKNLDNILVYMRSGADMYRRRSDRARLKTAIQFRKNLYKTGYISKYQYFKSVIATKAFIYSPFFVKKYVYKYILRRDLK